MSSAQIAAAIEAFEADVKAGKYDAAPVSIDRRKLTKKAAGPK